MKFFAHKARKPKTSDGPRVAASSRHKVVITGPGRSGTTFLMQLLTDLHFDTGFSSDSMDISAVSHAGLEQGLFSKPHRKAPLTPNYIIKSPLISDILELGCEREDLVLDHVYIPIRPLTDVAKSRARVSEIAGGEHPGGLESGASYETQLDRSARSFYALMDTVTRHEISYSLIAFPRLVDDCDYLYRKLHFLCAGIDYSTFKTAFDQRVNPDLVNRFGENPAAT